MSPEAVVQTCFPFKHAVITGASGGIGQALARAFAQRGCRVTLGCHTQWEEAEKLAEDLREWGGNARAVKADISTEEGVNRLFEAAEKEFGAVELLINNAAVAHRGLFTDITLAEWNALFSVNVTGSFLCCRRALPSMIREKRGCIINISSMWGQVGASCEVAYSASKAAVIGLTKALAKEEGPSGVRVNCIAPGLIDTPMNGGLSQNERQALWEDTPLLREGTPREVAQAALFLAENGFITGQVLGLNGGFVI